MSEQFRIGKNGAHPTNAPKLWTSDKIRALTAPSLQMLKEVLLERKPQARIGLIDRAFALMLEYNKDQTFFEGQPVVFIKIHVATRLARWGMNENVIAAALTDSLPPKTIQRVLGKAVENVLYRAKKSESLEKFACEGKDNPRQADYCMRLKGLEERELSIHLFSAARTIEELREAAGEGTGHFSSSFRERVYCALNITAPFLMYLGFYEEGQELRDNAFQLLRPDEFREAESLLQKKLRKNRYEALSELRVFAETLAEKLKEAGIKHVRHEQRIKTVYRAHKKIEAGVAPEKITDGAAMRFITDTVENCYEIRVSLIRIMADLGWNDQMYDTRDYITTAKPNGYQSIHMRFKRSAIYEDEGTTIEIQIRTEEMHAVAEFGKPSHLFYENPNLPQISVKGSNAEERFKKFVTYLSEQGLFYGFGPDGTLYQLRVMDNTLKPTYFDLAVRIDAKRAFQAVSVVSLKTGKPHFIFEPLRDGDKIKFDTPSDNSKNYLKSIEDNFNSLIRMARTSFANLLVHEAAGKRTLSNESAANMGEVTLKDRIERFFSSIEPAVDEIKTIKPGEKLLTNHYYSLPDIARELGFPSDVELFEAIELDSKQGGAFIEEVLKKLAAAYILTAYSKKDFEGLDAEGSKNELLLWLVSPNRRGIIQRMTELFFEYGINVKNMSVDTIMGGQAVRYGCVIDLDTKTTFNLLRSRLLSFYRDLELETEKGRVWKLAVSIDFIKDRIGLAAEVMDVISSAGGHILAGNIGELNPSKLEIEVPEWDRKKVTKDLLGRLNRIKEVGEVHLSEITDVEI
jgi:ppGpp synthetase/RelA/SpoT-type nucleotidyltranferase/predicted amino acid-binding ACT domain protein